MRQVGKYWLDNNPEDVGCYLYDTAYSDVPRHFFHSEQDALNWIEDMEVDQWEGSRWEREERALEYQYSLEGK